MGGSAQNTLLSCIGLTEKSYEVILVHGLSLESQITAAESASVEKLLQKAKAKGMKQIILSPLIRSINPLKDLWALIGIFRILKKENPDILHTHTSKAGFLGRWAGKLAGVPVVVHTPHGHVFYGHFGRWVSKVFLLLERLTAPITDCVIALTDGEKKDYLDIPIYSKNHLVTIHSGVDIQRFSTPSVSISSKKLSLGLQADTRVVGTMGWLLPIKAPDILFDAMVKLWKTFPDIALIFVGKGPLQSDLAGRADRLGVSDRVRFLGWRNDVHEILPVFDLFVLPSLNEGMGRVLVEAMAAGRPIVASRTGGVPDLVKDGKNGLLVPPGDVPALAEAVMYMIKHPDQAGKMGECGRKMCPEFSRESMVDKLDSLYKDLLL